MINPSIFLEIAEKDLEASKLLFDKGLYSQAIFFQQQAVEKINKSISTEYSTIRPIDTKNSGHDSIKLFKSLLEDQIEGLSTADSKHPLQILTGISGVNVEDYENSVRASIESLKEMKSHGLDRLSEIHIIELLELIQTILEEPKLPEQIEILSSMSLRELLNVYQTSGVIERETVLDTLKILQDSPDIEDLLRNKFNRFFTSLLPKYTSSSTAAFYLSIAFTLHAVKSRYPDYNQGHNPLDYYDAKNPLIVHLSEFHGITNQVISSIKDFNEETNSLF